MFSFALYFWWMGSHPWFLFPGFFSSLFEAPSSFSVFSANQVERGEEEGSEFSTLMIQERVFQEPMGPFHTPLSLQSYSSDVKVCNPLVGQVHVNSFTTQEWSMINSEHYLYIAYSKLHIIVALQWSQNVLLTWQAKDKFHFHMETSSTSPLCSVCMHQPLFVSSIYSQKSYMKN